MNNKGQTLVTFIILIPLVFLLLGLIYDIGVLVVEKKKIENSIKEIMEYSLNNIDDSSLSDKINFNLKKNLKDINITTSINNNIIKINIKKEIKTILIKVISKTKLDITYKGEIKDNKIIITKE